MRKKLTKFAIIIGGVFYLHTLIAAALNQDVETFTNKASDLRPKVLTLAIKAYDCALKRGIKSPRQILTIIDYSMPSSTKRLWVLNMKKKKVLFHTFVAHGKYSGLDKPYKFSNQPSSQESSIGLYRTKSTYFGHDGYSLVLQGLDKGFNDKAESRHIIMHGAWYVSKDVIRRYGRIGRSWGCPALNENIVKPIINTIKDGTLIFAYYPDSRWLRKSIYLHC